MWRTKLAECFRIFTGCKGRSLRIVCAFLPDVVDEAYGLFTDFYRIWGTKLTDCLQMFTDLHRIWGSRLADCFWIWAGFGREGLWIAYGFLLNVEDEAYGMFPDFYRMWRTRLTDCLQIFTGFGGGGLPIVYGFGPDLGEKAYGFGGVWVLEP